MEDNRLTGCITTFVVFILIIVLFMITLKYYYTPISKEKYIYGKVIKRIIEDERHFILVETDTEKVLLLCENNKKEENNSLTIYHSLVINKEYEFKILEFTYDPLDIKYPIILSATSFLNNK